ncbi:LOW QUALITY PROTEIN: tumor necrosis factor alpha-induced protein 2-like [Anomaloglossus baeobatrachus]|uniref:LOW QUALITY PROTEIN: tumor necrosis factor alpha-induced protein 2-like n=1 Tax=Anomaloglossus baeobatrachus TaxID=238106 RepID=UPI003F4FA4E0
MDFFLQCRRILRDPLIQGHIDESKLQILLPPRTIEQLERTYVECEEDKLETQLEKSLDLEVKRWNDRKEPVQEGRYYLSGLEKDVTKIFIASLKRTAKISETMSCKMAPCLGRKLQDFLTRYHNLVVEYTVTLKKKEKCFWNITIANINSILAFRNLLESKDLRIQGETKETLNHVLHEFETLGYNALLQDLFEKLKPHFKKLQHGKDRKQNCTEIMDNVMSCISSLKHLCQPYYQVMISKIHSQMVLEYVTQVLENPVRLENSIQLKFAAAQMAKNADKIKFYFKRKGSQEIWLDPLLNQLANIIKALNQEDTINEICTLAEQYTDLSREHIVAILHIKGNINIHEARSALEKIEYRRRHRNISVRSRPLFSRITPFSSDWLFRGYRRHGVDFCCLNICGFVQYTRNMFIHLCCKLVNVDTPPKYYPH